MQKVAYRSLKPGEQAPNIALKDSDMKSVSIDDYQGKTVVVVFFPAAFSGVCTKELCTFTSNLALLNEIDAVVLGVSVDLPYTLKEFRRASHISFPLLSDFDRIAIRDYGVVDDDFKGYHSGVAQRSIFVIDPSGAIAWSWVSGGQAEEPEYADVLQAAEAAGHGAT